MKIIRRSIAGIVLILFLAAVLLVNGKEPVILKIGEQSVRQEEYEMIMDRQKSDIYNYFTSVYEVQPGDLAWDGNYYGECPGDMLSERTVDKLIKNNYIFCAAKQYGILEDSSFENFQKEWKKEVSRRKDAQKNGQVIAGPVDMGVYEYYDYYLEELKGEVKQQLWKDGSVSMDDLSRYYENKKDTHFRKEAEAQAVRIFTAKEDGKEEESIKLMKDIRLRLSQSEDMTAELEKIKKEGRCKVEVIDLNEGSRHHDESVYKKLMEQILNGKEGELTQVTSNSNSYDVGIIREVNKTGYYTFEEVKLAVEHDYKEELFKQSQEKWIKENNPVIYRRKINMG